MAEVRVLSPKEKAFQELAKLPPDFCWGILGAKIRTGDLIAHVREESDLGKQAIQLVPGFSGDVPTVNQLGKRLVCVLCGTQMLCTKAGPGVVACCGQPALLMLPKALPGSD